VDSFLSDLAPSSFPPTRASPVPFPVPTQSGASDSYRALPALRLRAAVTPVGQASSSKSTPGVPLPLPAALPPIRASLTAHEIPLRTYVLAVNVLMGVDEGPAAAGSSAARTGGGTPDKYEGHQVASSKMQASTPKQISRRSRRDSSSSGTASASNASRSGQ